MRTALRQDPDVILVGEMRDFETIETALLAAETGHLVFSTLHTLDATETINRIIAVFPPHQQKQIRLQLASVLQGRHLAAPHAARRRPGPLPGRRGPGHHALHPRLHRRQGEDAPHPGRRSPPARRSTACRRSTSRSSACSAQGLVTYDEALRWATNVDEFKLKVQGIATAPTTRATRWRGASSAAANPRPRSPGSGARPPCRARRARPGRPRRGPEGGLRLPPCGCSPAGRCRRRASASALVRAAFRTT